MTTKTYTTSYGKRKITLKRGIAEYFNEDCPPIEDENGNRIFSNFINGVFVDPDFDKKIVHRFVKSSYNLFCKKYNYPIKSLQWIEDILN